MANHITPAALFSVWLSCGIATTTATHAAGNNTATHTAKPAMPAFSVAVGEWQLRKLAKASAIGAVCLDGSPPGYYVRWGADRSSFKVHFKGGGWCMDDQSCLSRSKGWLGSSESWTPVRWQLQKTTRICSNVELRMFVGMSMLLLLLPFFPKHLLGPQL